MITVPAKEPKIVLSIIIPAKNESRHIIGALTQALIAKKHLSTEVIVIDNNSTDDTFSIAKTYADITLQLPDANISEVRNFGANVASGRVLAFIDADVEITDEWRKEITYVSVLLKENPLAIYGARCHAPHDSGFLNKYWFNRMLEYKSDYINSGNLITSKTLFNEICGFNETLTTAEDWDFCKRALAFGSPVTERKSLVTIHKGYPDTFKAFIARERWHGKQDFKSFTSFINSKVAIVCAINILAICTALLLTVATVSILYTLYYLAFLFTLSTLLTIIRYKTSSIGKLAFTSGIFALYITSRSLSSLDQITSMVVKNQPADSDT